MRGHLSDISGGILCAGGMSGEGWKGSISPNSLFGEYRQIIIYFREVSHSSISASILYVDTPISQLRLNPSKRDWVACFGYLTVSSKSNEMYSTIPGPKLGRASCRERVCQYVSISVVAVSLKK